MNDLVITGWIALVGLEPGLSGSKQTIGKITTYQVCGEDGHSVAEWSRKELRLHVEWMPKSPYPLSTSTFEVVGQMAKLGYFWNSFYCAYVTLHVTSEP